MFPRLAEVDTTERSVSIESLIHLRPEQRDHRRREVTHDLWLTDLGGDTILRCKCRNLSAGGLYAVAPVGYGLAVGQRYELRMSPGVTRSASMLLGDTLGYATVIRTHMNVHTDEDTVGVAMRFDVPRYLPI